MTNPDASAHILQSLTAAQCRDLLKAYQRKGAGLLCLRTRRHLMAHGLVERVPYQGTAGAPDTTWKITAAWRYSYSKGTENEKPSAPHLCGQGAFAVSYSMVSKYLRQYQPKRGLALVGDNIIKIIVYES